MFRWKENCFHENEYVSFLNFLFQISDLGNKFPLFTEAELDHTMHEKALLRTRDSVELFLKQTRIVDGFDEW